VNSCISILHLKVPWWSLEWRTSFHHWFPLVKHDQHLGWELGVPNDPGSSQNHDVWSHRCGKVPHLCWKKTIFDGQIPCVMVKSQFVMVNSIHFLKISSMRPSTTTLPRFRQVLTGHGELFQLPLSFGIGWAEGLRKKTATTHRKKVVILGVPPVWDGILSLRTNYI